MPHAHVRAQLYVVRVFSLFTVWIVLLLSSLVVLFLAIACKLPFALEPWMEILFQLHLLCMHEHWTVNNMHLCSMHGEHMIFYWLWTTSQFVHFIIVSIWRIFGRLCITHTWSIYCLYSNVKILIFRCLWTKYALEFYWKMWKDVKTERNRTAYQLPFIYAEQLWTVCVSDVKQRLQQK